VGEGPGKGFNVNVGWRSKGMADEDYLVGFSAPRCPTSQAEPHPALLLARSRTHLFPHPQPQTSAKQAAYDLLLLPIISQFDPQLVIIAAGFDAVEADPLGGCHVTPEGYAEMTERLLRLAGGRVVAVLEGGYNTG
jgi:acetoin utilization deacetylase AcuC-like enzyme